MGVTPTLLCMLSGKAAIFIFKLLGVNRGSCSSVSTGDGIYSRNMSVAKIEVFVGC
jgi:hypothetical protein